MGAALLALCISAACESNQINLSTETTVTWSEPIEMQTYTPQPIPITDVTVELPQDVIDDVVVGTVNPTLQQLADAALYNQQLEGAVAAWLRFLGPATVANGDLCPITINGRSPVSGWSIASNELTVPSTGVYLVIAQARVTASTISNNVPLTISVRRDGVNQGDLFGVRYTDDNGVSAVVSGNNVVVITDPSTQKISFQNDSGGPIALHSSLTTNGISVVRLGSFVP